MPGQTGSKTALLPRAFVKECWWARVISCMLLRAFFSGELTNRLQCTVTAMMLPPYEHI
ncbi:MAG: hypothetical protein ACFFC7_04815 [Candidatus Hermodarchaeota archaeon]